jgi:hypothetical protein
MVGVTILTRSQNIGMHVEPPEVIFWRGKCKRPLFNEEMPWPAQENKNKFVKPSTFNSQNGEFQQQTKEKRIGFTSSPSLRSRGADTYAKLSVRS